MGAHVELGGSAAAGRCLGAAFHRSTAPSARKRAVANRTRVQVAEAVYSIYLCVSASDVGLESERKIPDLHDGQHDSDAQFTSVQPPR